MAMAARPPTPSHEAYTTMPHPSDPAAHLTKGYGTGPASRPTSYLATTSTGPSEYNAAHGAPVEPSPLSQGARLYEELDTTTTTTTTNHRSSLALDGSARAALQRADSQMSRSHSPAPSRVGTLKKKASLSKRSSLRRSGSRRSLRAGSVRSLNLGDKEKYGAEDPSSAFYVPIPTNVNPTEVLANRFQAWRKVLKDLILFFKDIQKSYETRAKLLLSAANVINNMSLPPTFLASGGLADATEILRDYHRQGIIEANKARELENEVVLQLTGLRSDLQQKTKEIKNLSGDFKNSVEKEMEGTRKAIRNLHEALGLVDTDPAATSGKGDPFIVRLSVEKQIAKQIEEENYLHRAFLNLESSGRELESIVVGEIQKAYNAYASILKREADEAYDTVEKLRAGPISMPKDHEWNAFLAGTDQLVDPRTPLRSVENITYPGKDHPAAAEVRSGMLERKSKYLKSYTPGWYVLSPTHLHEFKSADRIAWQTPVMSLYLPEQKLGSHSQPDSTSHKFMLKGRQTGSMHRGHAWVFRAESHDTMMAWYYDIENLIGKTGEARNAYVRRHLRTVSAGSFKASSISSDGVMDEDEADRTPYSADSTVLNQEPPAPETQLSSRPQPGGRFPSDVQIDRHLHAPLSPSSGESSGDREASGQPAPPGQENEANRNQPADELGDRSDMAALERHSSYYGDLTGNNPTATSATASMPVDRKQQPVHDTGTDGRPALQIQKSNSSNAPIVIAAPPPSVVVDHRDDNNNNNNNNLPDKTQPSRHESASTVPTSSTTDSTSQTSNTAPTSSASGGDKDKDNMTPSAIAVETYRQLKRQESQRLATKADDDNDDDNHHHHHRSSSPAGSSTLASTATSPVSTTAPTTTLTTTTTSMSTQQQTPPQDVTSTLATRPAAQSKESVSTLELKIPGRYPPNNANTNRNNPSSPNLNSNSHSTSTVA